MLKETSQSSERLIQKIHKAREFIDQHYPPLDNEDYIQSHVDYISDAIEESRQNVVSNLVQELRQLSLSSDCLTSSDPGNHLPTEMEITRRLEADLPEEQKQLDILTELQLLSWGEFGVVISDIAFTRGLIGDPMVEMSEIGEDLDDVLVGPCMRVDKLHIFYSDIRHLQNQLT